LYDISVVMYAAQLDFIHEGDDILQAESCGAMRRMWGKGVEFVPVIMKRLQHSSMTAPAANIFQ
jgi:hypothetical protein